MRGEFRRGGIIGPLLLIGLGIIFLLNNLGFLEWGVEETLLRLWPVLLIALGLDLLLPRRSAIGAVISLMVILAAIVGALFLVSLRSGGDLAPKAEQVSLPLGMTKEAHVLIEPGVGVIRIDALQDSNLLLAGALGLSRGQSVEREVSRRDGLTKIRLRSMGGWLWPAFDSDADSGAGGGEWRLGIHPQPRLHLELRLGAGDLALDLSELSVQALHAEVGIGKTVVQLPTARDFNASLKGGVGTMEVIVPRGLAIQIQVSAGLSSARLEGFSKEGDSYFSLGAQRAEEVAHLRLHQAIGGLIVRYE